MIAARFIHHAQTRWEDWFRRFSPQFLPLAAPRTARLIVVTLLRIHDLKIGDTLEYYASLLPEKKGSPVVGDHHCRMLTNSLQRVLALSAILAGHP
ncbi:MAG: hypothetical protein ACLP4V_20535 [Methylocella sp.]